MVDICCEHTCEPVFLVCAIHPRNWEQASSSVHISPVHGQIGAGCEKVAWCQLSYVLQYCE